jgi:hypothetical protein
VAKLGGGDFAEDEAIVPLAACLLQGFKLRGEAVGRDGGAGSGLCKVAGEFGALADFVQLGGGAGGLRWRVRPAVTAEPVAEESDQVGLGDRERARGGECVQQFREDVGEFVALLVENFEQVPGLFAAGALEVTAEAAGFAAEGVVGRCRRVGGRGFGADEIALDVDVADLAGSLAQALEQAESSALLLVMRRKAGEHREQDELGLDAAGRGAEAMDGFRVRVGQTGEHCGVQRSRQFAEGLHGMRRLSCFVHSIWVGTVTKAGKAATHWRIAA